MAVCMKCLRAGIVDYLICKSCGACAHLCQDKCLSKVMQKKAKTMKRLRDLERGAMVPPENTFKKKLTKDGKWVPVYVPSRHRNG